MRAVKRVERLGMTNCRFFQGNMDYFSGKFDVGVSLHACGVATDLVRVIFLMFRKYLKNSQL